MMKRNFTAALAIFAMVSLFAFSGPAGAAKKIKIPPGKAIDLRIIENGKVTAQGVKAVKQISRANLVLYLAGNQFMAMGDVIGEFQKTHPGVKKSFRGNPPAGADPQANPPGRRCLQGSHRSSLPGYIRQRKHQASQTTGQKRVDDPFEALST